jgi:branched-chain amino acid transport system ATP-binding protein
METILEVNNVVKQFGGFTALSGVNVKVHKGERLGLIGPNGSGKTTLINCISGAFTDYEGAIHFNGQDISKLKAHERTKRGIARSFQIPRPFSSMTVMENLLVPFAFVGGKDGPEQQEEAMTILRGMGLADKAFVQSNQLSQVELRKMELARAMAAKPKLLISDEAMAGLSGNEVDEVLDILLGLNKLGITIIMIEHIMQAVMKFSERIICLDVGKIICEGTPETIVKNPEVQRAYLGD